MSRVRLRGALFGVGRMGTLHAERLAERPDVALTLVDPARGYPALPERAALDFAVIATPAETHAEVALPLLARGVPCLVEKPLAADLEQAAALARWPRLSVGHIERYNPALAAVADARPRYIAAERLAPFSGRGADVDVIADLMVHDLDLARRFLPGPLRDVRAVGVGVLTGQIDIANARLELGGGVAAITASRVSREPARTLRLFEDGLYWSVDLRARTVQKVRWGSGALVAEPVEVPPGDALRNEHAAFLAAVRGEAPFPVPGAEALEVLTLAARVRATIQEAR